jgi:hypothetical protein
MTLRGELETPDADFSLDDRAGDGLGGGTTRGRWLSVTLEWASALPQDGKRCGLL